MSRLVVRRLLSTIPVLLGATIVIFLMIHLIPGDPAQIMLQGSDATAAQIKQLHDKLGLNRPLIVQYWVYLRSLLHGDLGTSYMTGVSLNTAIGVRLPATLELTAAGMFVAVAGGIPLGVIAAARPRSVMDRLASGVAVLGVGIPNFWLAIVLVLIFSVQLGWLPALSTGGISGLVLPAISLGWAFTAIIARLLRDRLIHVMDELHVTASRAMGLGPVKLLLSHGLRNAVPDVVTMLGVQTGNMLTGAVVIEIIFGRTGLGSYLVQSIQDKDIPAVQSIVLVITVAYVIINLIVDLLYGVLDPRVGAD